MYVHIYIYIHMDRSVHPRCPVEFHVPQLETRAGAAGLRQLRRPGSVPWLLRFVDVKQTSGG